MNFRGARPFLKSLSDALEGALNFLLKCRLYDNQIEQKVALP